MCKFYCLNIYELKYEKGIIISLLILSKQKQKQTANKQTNETKQNKTKKKKNQNALFIMTYILSIIFYTKKKKQEEIHKHTLENEKRKRCSQKRAYSTRATLVFNIYHYCSLKVLASDMCSMICKTPFVTITKLRGRMYGSISENQCIHFDQVSKYYYAYLQELQKFPSENWQQFGERCNSDKAEYN